MRYDPSIDLNYSELPQTYITGIKLFYEDVDWVKKGFNIGRFTKLPENLILSHNDNHLTFTFTGLSYTNPNELELSYFLENQDLSLVEQKEVFVKTLDEWIEHPSDNSPGGQIDDIILIGVRI